LADLVLQLKEWECILPTPGSITNGVFLSQDAATSQVVDALRADDALDIQELRAGVSVRATSFVGRVRLGNILIVIEPKIRGVPLMRLLRYTYGLRDLRLLTAAGAAIENDSFQDLLVWQLLAEVRELIARGLHRQYVPQSARLANPRGRLDMQAIARQPAVTAGLPCNFHPRLEDCGINRALLFGLRLGSRLALDRELRSDLRRSAQLIDDQVSDSPLDLLVIERMRREITRLTIAYEPSLAIIQILLESAGASLSRDETETQSPGFLFDMNRLFQRLLARFLTENLPEYQVTGESRISGMMAYAPLYNPRLRRAPSPRPDFRVRSTDGRVYLLDAKYRDLWSETLPREMLYQLSIYALSQKPLGRATILYPTLDESAKDAVVCIRDPFSVAPRAEVVLRPVNLMRLADLVAAPASSQVLRRKRAEAGRWICPPA
jgi:5-methylcytosine-specific restriction enzyme subunit McrC